MNFFSYQNDTLCAESVRLVEIAERFGTPSYVYSRAAIEFAYREFDQACSGRDVLICYSVKANSNLAVLNVLARLGSGFDIVSGGELARVLAVGGSATKTVFSGVGKSVAEMRAALQTGVLCFNVESEDELERLAKIAAELGKIAPVSLRINPDVDPRTHPHIATGLRETKFGVPYEDAPRLYRKAASMPSLQVAGIDFHIGSQLTEIEPFVAALDKALEFNDALGATGIRLQHIDLGGGLGIRYRDEKPPTLKDYLGQLFGRIGNRKLKVLFEPGRSLVGNAGLLLTRVEYLKNGDARSFVVTDAAIVSAQNRERDVGDRDGDQAADEQRPRRIPVAARGEPNRHAHERRRQQVVLLLDPERPGVQQRIDLRRRREIVAACGAEVIVRNHRRGRGPRLRQLAALLR